MIICIQQQTFYTNMMKQNKTDNKLTHYQIISNLKDRLSINNIYKEFQLVRNMNSLLEIKLNAFLKMDSLKGLSKDEVIKIIKQIPFLSYNKQKKWEQQQQKVCLNYENGNRVLLVTGITKQALVQMLQQFNARRYHDFTTNKPVSSKVIGSNGFWVAIETSSEENASALKKHLRSRKKTNDQSQHTYKIEGKRIRIVVLKEDFHSLLIDAITEIKSEMFYKSFQSPFPMVERRKSQQITSITAQLKRKNIVYRSIIINSYSTRNDMKEEELSDGFSQSNSLNSDILDSSKMKDLIETSQQGIQSQSNGQYSQYVQQQPENFEQKDNVYTQVQIQLPVIVQQSIKDENLLKEQYLMIVKDQQLRQQLDQLTMGGIASKGSMIDKGYQQILVTQVASINEEKLTLNFPSPLVNLSNLKEQIQSYSPLKPIETKEILIKESENIYSSIPFSTMKRLYMQFKRSAPSSQMIELPDWAKIESDQQRNRHRFFGSLCRRKIISSRRSPFQ